MSLVFGKYERIRRIAQGGMGDVYLARQTGVLDRLAILKSLRADLAKEREFVDQFLDEARVAATLNHPNIVAIYDVGEWNGTYYIAMEYVAGEDLSRLWYAAAKASVGLPFQVSVRIILEAAQALDHAHRAKDVRGAALSIVHRDVSPQNIMVRGDGVVKLVDFGIAKAANKASHTQAGMVKGKLQYMAPEQVRGETLDGRSDEFSLGTVLWEMCTGRRLFKAENEIQTLQKILQLPMPRPSQHVPGFPPALEATIMRMLERDPEKRFKTLADAAAELKVYLDHAGMDNGEVSVAGFVQQILGAQLEERTRDLTPMPTSDPAIVAPATTKAEGAKPDAHKPGAQKAEAQPADGQKAAPFSANAVATVVARPHVEANAAPPSEEGNANEIVVKRKDTAPRRFDDLHALQQWILDGNALGDDLVAMDGKSFSPLSSTTGLVKFLHIASAAKAVKTPGDPAAFADDDVMTSTGSGVFTESIAATRPAGILVRPVQQSTHAITDPHGPDTDSEDHGTQPERPSARSSDEPDTVALPRADLGPQPTGAFTLGELPLGATGTWAQPDISAALEHARAKVEEERRVALGNLDETRPSGRKVTPAPAGAARAATKTGRPVSPVTQPLREPFAKRRTALIVAAVLGTTVVAAGIAAALVLRSRGGADALGPAVKDALVAARGDEPPALDALLSAARSSAWKPGTPLDVQADDVAAEVVLQVARARIDFEVDALIRLSTAVGVEKISVGRPDTSVHAARAKALLAALEANQKAEHAEPSLGQQIATLNVMSLQAAPAGFGELAARVRALESVDHAAVDTECAALALLADVVRTIDGAQIPKDDPARIALLKKLRAAVRADASADLRLQNAGSVLQLIGLAVDSPGGEHREADMTALKERATAAAGVDVRARLLLGALGALHKRPAVAAATSSGPDEQPKDATADAETDAGVVVDTYESLMEQAQRQRKAGHPADAAALYVRALDKKPGAPRATIALAWVQVELKKPDQAEALFRDLLTRDDANVDAHFGLAEVLRIAGRTEDARGEYQRYLELAPNGKQADAARAAVGALE